MKREEIEKLYNDPLEKQAKTVKGFDEEVRTAFRRGKITERFIRYFYNQVEISDARMTCNLSSDKERKAAAQKVIDEKTAENSELRDYVTVASFIEKNKNGNPALISFAMALPELSDGVKKELLFDNTFLLPRTQQASRPLTKEEEASLTNLSKALSRSVKDDSAAFQKAILAKGYGR